MDLTVLELCYVRAWRVYPDSARSGRSGRTPRPPKIMPLSSCLFLNSFSDISTCVWPYCLQLSWDTLEATDIALVNQEEKKRNCCTVSACVVLRGYRSEVITIDDDVIEVDTCDSQTSESAASTTTTVSLDWNFAPSATPVTRSLLILCIMYLTGVSK